MKKFDVIYYDTSRGHYKQRVDASSKDSAKNKVVKMYEGDLRKVEKITKVDEAEDIVIYQYFSYKIKDGTFGFKKQYYVGYHNLGMFGIAPEFTADIQKAKRFMMKYEAENEIKKIGRKLSEFKFEKVKA